MLQVGSLFIVKKAVKIQKHKYYKIIMQKYYFFLFSLRNELFKFKKNDLVTGKNIPKLF